MLILPAIKIKKEKIKTKKKVNNFIKKCLEEKPQVEENDEEGEWIQVSKKIRKAETKKTEKPKQELQDYLDEF